jgi:hypothetical protein
LAYRDIAAAWLSWQRASRVADALSMDGPDTTAMRIAARTVLCANAFRAHVDISGGLFEELRQLCAAAGDKNRWPSACPGWWKCTRPMAAWARLRGWPPKPWRWSSRSAIRP